MENENNYLAFNPDEGLNTNSEATQPNFESQGFDGNPSPKKKGKKGLIIGVVAAVVVALGGVGVYAARNTIVNKFQQTFYEPDEYYRTIEKRVINDYLDAYKSNYNYSVDTFKSDELTMDLEAEVSDFGKLVDYVLQENPDIDASSFDFSNLKSVAAFMTLSKDKDSAGFELGAKVNNNELLSGNASFNLADKEVYAQIPAISDDYVDLSAAFSEISDEDMAELDQIFELYGNLFDIYPSSDDMADMYERYFDIVLNSITDVEKEKGTIEANDVEQKCTILTVNVSGEDLYNICCDVVDELKDEEIVIDMIDGLLSSIKSMDLDSSDLDDLENFDAETYRESVSELKDQLKEHKDDFKDLKDVLEMNVYVDNSGKILGREITVTVEDKEATIYSLMAISSKKYGYEAGVEVDGKTICTLEGEGNYNLKDFDGEYEFYIPEEDLKVFIALDNCNTVDMLTDSFSGDISISTNYDALKDMELKLTIDSKRDSFYIKASGYYQNNLYASVSLDFKLSTDAKSYAPNKSANIITINSEDDLKNYINKLDVANYVNDVLDACDIEMSDNIINALLGDVTAADLYDSIMEEMSSDDYDYDDFDYDDYDSEDYEDYDFDDYDLEDYEDYDYDDYDLEDFEDYDFDDYDLEDYEDYDFDVEDYNSEDYDDFDVEF